MSLPVATTFYTLLTEAPFNRKQFRKMYLLATTFYTLPTEAYWRLFYQKQFLKMSLQATTFYTSILTFFPSILNPFIYKNSAA